jgi:enoyl-CoA hydratase
MSDVVVETLEPGIELVKLNRPEARNALSPGLLTELMDAMKRLSRDRTTRAVILHGAGRGFCAGADLVGGFELEGTEQMSELGQVYKFQEYIADTILAIHECEKPVIAAVHGAAVGGGLAISLACDLRVAADSAKFGSVFIKVGLSSCDVGTSYFLPRIVGPARAFELMITGRHFGAAEAERIGLVHAIVPEGREIESALETARLIAANNEYGVWMTKKGMWSNLDAPSLRHAMEIENRTQVLGTFTGNMLEAMQAFQQKRDPVWKPL